MKNIYFSLIVLASFLIIAEEMEKSKVSQKVREVTSTQLERSALYDLKRSSQSRYKTLNNIEGQPDR